MLGQVDLAVVHHDGLRRHRRQQRLPVLISELCGIHDHLGGQAVIRRAGIGPPGGGVGQRPDRLEQHCRRVHRLGRHRSQPQPGDAPVIQVHTGGQLGLHPAQRHRVHREHVQPSGVQQQVLAGPRRPQPPVGGGRAAGDLTPGLGAAERAGAFADLPQQGARPSPARQRYRTLAVLGLQAGRDLGQDQLLGRRAGVGVLGQHCAGHRQPAGISPAPGRLVTPPPVIDQPGRAALVQGGCPAADRAHPDLKLRGLGLIPLELAGAGRVFRPRLTGQGQLRAAVAVAGARLADMRHPLAEPGQLSVIQWLGRLHLAPP